MMFDSFVKTRRMYTQSTNMTIEREDRGRKNIRKVF